MVARSDAVHLAGNLIAFWRSKFLQVVVAVGLEIADLNGAVINTVFVRQRITVSNRRNRLATVRGICVSLVHTPRGASQGIVVVVYLVDLNDRALGRVRAVPRQVVAFLIHIKRGSRVAALVVEELVESTVISIANRIRIVHGEIPANPYTTVGAHVRFEAAIRHEDAAEHASGRIILSLHGKRLIPYAISFFQIGVCVPTRRSATTLATMDNHICSVSKIPHDLLRTLSILRVRIRTTKLTLGTAFISPPETPTVMEIHVLSGHINDHGSAIGNTGKVETDTRIARRIIEKACGKVEHLHRGFPVTLKLNYLLIDVVNRKSIATVVVLIDVIFRTLQIVIAVRRICRSGNIYASEPLQGRQVV